MSTQEWSFGLESVAGAPYLQVKLTEKTYRRLGEQGLDVPAAGIYDLISRKNVVLLHYLNF